MQQASNDPVAAFAGTEFVTAVVVAGDSRVELKAVGKGLRAIPQMLGVVLEGAFIEGGRPFILG
ncbi:hypothetical protein D3C86_2186800 [compost metagenome]